jgi:hypothetical protein
VLSLENMRWFTLMIYIFKAGPLMSILIIYVLFLMLYMMHVYLVTLRSALLHGLSLVSWICSHSAGN